jgi:nitrate reductase gamma subunit
MSYLQLLIGQLMPFITVAVLVSGLTARLVRWQRAAAVVDMALYPVARNRASLWRRLLSEVLLFTSFRQQHRTLWWHAWLFHLALGLIILGHTRLITDWPLQGLLGLSDNAAMAISVWIGGGAGLVAMATCLLLLLHRLMVRRAREVSTGEDYMLALLLLSIFITGNLMRWLPAGDLSQVHLYLSSLVRLEVAQIPADPIFLLHIFLVQVLLVYLPFGKLLHAPGIFFSRALIAKDF